MSKGYPTTKNEHKVRRITNTGNSKVITDSNLVALKTLEEHETLTLKTI